METRIEKDIYGEVEIPKEKYWGIQTQRALENTIKSDQMVPFELIQAYAMLKRAVAEVNYDKGELSNEKFLAIKEAALAIEEGELKDHFPLNIWQSDSGKLTHANVNEVVVNYSNVKHQKHLLDATEDVSKHQHTHDTYPTAMFIASYFAIHNQLMPEIEAWIDALADKEEKAEESSYAGITQFQPTQQIKTADELSGWREALAIDKERVKRAAVDFRYFAFGGGEVGNEEDVSNEFSTEVAQKLKEYTDEEFGVEKNKFLGLSFRGEFAFGQGALQSLMATLTKITNDMQLFYSPLFQRSEAQENAEEENSDAQRELTLLQEAIMQATGNGVTIQMAISQSHFQTNPHLPLIIYNFLQSINSIAQSMSRVRRNVL